MSTLPYVVMSRHLGNEYSVVRLIERMLTEDCQDRHIISPVGRWLGSQAAQRY